MANRKGIGGPNTPDGKQASSQNAVKHSCCSSKRLVPGESAEEYERFWKMWIDRYGPDCDHDVYLIGLTVDAAWHMQRSERAFANCEARLYKEQPDSTLWTDEQHKQWQRFHRYKTADTNAFHKALRLIDSLKKSAKQNFLVTEKMACQLIENLREPEPLKEVKEKVKSWIERPITLPTTREDGGCTCPPCLAEYGIVEYEKNKAAWLANQPLPNS
jgi:hypothetical protein